MPALSNWNDYIKEFAKFSRLADLPPAKRPLSLCVIEQRLLDGMGCFTVDAQITTVLEQAVRYGSRALIDALPKPALLDTAQLSPEEWLTAARNCDTDMLRTAISKGLQPPMDWEVVFNLFVAARDNPRMRSFLMEDVAASRWWFPAAYDITKRWLNISDSELAAQFLRRQVTCFRSDAGSILICFRHHEPDLSALLQLAGARLNNDTPSLPDLIAQQETAHEKIEVQAAFLDLARAHDFLRETRSIARSCQRPEFSTNIDRKLP